MKSDLKSIYGSKYVENSFDNDNNSEMYDSEDLMLPTGWSFICLDETINYYTDCNYKGTYVNDK